MTGSASRRLNRLVVQFVEAGDAAARAESVAQALPGGRVERVSRRGRAVIAVDGDPAELASAVGSRDEVAWAEADVVDRAQ